MNRLILIDGNPLLYRSYYAKGTSGLKTSRGELSGAFYGALRTFQALQNRFPKADYLFAFDRGLSGREKIFTGYKPLSGTYTDNSKPPGFSKQLLHVQEFLRAMAIPVLTVNGIEADDLISVVTHEWIDEEDQQEFSVVIVSSDRDFLQLVSKQVLLYDDRAKCFFGPDDVESQFGVPVDRFVLYKSLIGDLADKIPPVEGYGPVRAKEAVLNDKFPKSGQKLKDFERNKDLIRLPKNSYAIQALTGVAQQKLESRIAEIFRGFLSGDYKSFHEDLNFDKAQEILNSYECKSLKLDYFSKYSRFKLSTHV